MKLFIATILFSLSALADVKVLMIDAGAPWRGESIPYNVHSAAMYQIINSNKCHATVRWCSTFRNGVFNERAYFNCLLESIVGNYSLVSQSMVGFKPIAWEKAMIEIATRNIVWVAASGNTGGNEHLYPASYDGVISVSSNLPSSTHTDKSIDYPGIVVYHDDDFNTDVVLKGTSVATAYYSRHLINGMCK
jgi:hypothetical protein